jgi:outer membrane lipoprotein-sorting protein
MKKSVKLFGLLMISVVLFSCSTDEQDEDLERAIKLSENMQQMQAREGDGTHADSTAKEDGTPIVVIKKDN